MSGIIRINKISLRLNTEFRDYLGCDGKENGNYRNYRGYIWVILGFILGFYRDNGKENGSYYLGLGCLM